MKATLVIVSLLTVTISLDAQYYFDQWYFKKCQVTSLNKCTPEEFDCLWTEANKLKTTGIVLTVTGTAIATIAGIVLATDPYSWTDWPDSYSWWLFGVYGIPTGILLDLIGIPCLYSARNRINLLKDTPCYKSQSAVSLNLTPTILRNHINNTYSVGLTASLRF